MQNHNKAYSAINLMKKYEIPQNVREFATQFTLAKKDSRKGQNGKVLIVGGSSLFHAASKWSLDVTAALVDMVFYSSVPENNELIAAAKGNFWNGIVVDRKMLDSYAQEADCILIGPGMDRSEQTKTTCESLFAKFPDKKWVIDAGALQMVDPALFPSNAIITPHYGELALLAQKLGVDQTTESWQDKTAQIFLEKGVRVILKGKEDLVYVVESKNAEGLKIPLVIVGGNPGMTKGGTGDVLAGLVAGLAATQPLDLAAVLGSFVNKRAADELYELCGPFFTTTQLAEKVPQTLWRTISDTGIVS